MRIGRLHSDPVLTVLDDRVVDYELGGRRVDVVGSKAFVVKIAGDAKFPIVVRIVNQRGFRKHPFEPQMISKKPDQSAAWRGDRI